MIKKSTSRSLKGLIGFAVVVSIPMGAPAVSAFQNGTPNAPKIISIESVKKSGNLFDLKVTLSVHKGNKELPTLSSVVKAGKKSCTTRGTRQVCTISRLTKNTKIRVSAVSKNKNGFSAKSPVAAYTVGTAKKSYQTTPATSVPSSKSPSPTTPTVSLPPSDGGYVSSYSISSLSL